MTRQEKINMLVEYCLKHTCPMDDPSKATCEIGKTDIGAALCEKRVISAMSERELDMMIGCIAKEKPETEKPAELAEKPAPAEEVNHPAHYQGKVECIDEMIAVFGVEAVIHFCALNVWKYRYRADRKGGEKDRAKADWYMQKIIELQKDNDEAERRCGFSVGDTGEGENR